MAYSLPTSDSNDEETTDFPFYIPLTTCRASATDDEDEQQQLQHYSSPTKRSILRCEELEGLGLAPESDIENEEESVEEEVLQEETLQKCEEQDHFYFPAYSSYYMHDDRCPDGRSGRTLGQDKPKRIELEGKWPHDKFEELSLKS